MPIVSTYPANRYIAPRVDVKRFTFTKGTFVAEASDFGARLPVGQLYDDACDAGLVLENRATNTAVPFYLAEDERDGEGELVAHHFAVCAEAARKRPDLAHLKITIFND